MKIRAESTVKAATRYVELDSGGISIFKRRGFLRFDFGLLWILVALGVLFPKVALARPLPTDVSGMIGSDTTWTAANSPFVLTGDVTVASNATLTIEPGGVVQGQSQAALVVRGHLDAMGTPTQPITFTSALDTGPGQWKGVVFDLGSGHLRHATVRYAGAYNGMTRANLTANL